MRGKMKKRKDEMSSRVGGGDIWEGKEEMKGEEEQK